MQTDSKKRHFELDAKTRQKLSEWQARLAKIKEAMTPMDAVVEVMDANPERFT